MEDTRVTIIVEGTFQKGYEKHFTIYSEKIRDFLKQHNAIVVRRQLIKETLFGDDNPNLIMLIDFPNKHIAKGVFIGEEYNSIIPLRNKVFKTFKMYLAELGDV